MRETFNKKDEASFEEKISKLKSEKKRAQIEMTLFAMISIVTIIAAMLLQSGMTKQELVITNILCIIVTLLCMICFVTSGFKYMDAKDSIKVLETREKTFKI